MSGTRALAAQRESGEPVAPPAFACPTCRGDLRPEPDSLSCRGCGRIYPVIAGIPDFRVSPDPWLDVEDDRRKALLIHELIAGHSFEEAVRTYWSITPSTPRQQAERFIEHVLSAERRSAQWLDRIGAEDSEPAGPWLDVGCGTGDLLGPLAARGARAVGVDVALRWLVVARRRTGLENASLVCCNAEALPFRDGHFATVSGLGLLEHTADEQRVMKEAARVLARGGALHMRTTNRYAPTREPHVGVWGVGYVPRRWADAFVRARSGERYLHHRPLSARELRRAAVVSGFVDCRVGAAPMLDAEVERLRAPARRFARVYDWARRVPGLGAALTLIAPLLEIHGTRA